MLLHRHNAGQAEKDMKTLNALAVKRITNECEAHHYDHDGVLELLELRAASGETPTVELRGVRDPHGYTVHVTASESDFEAA